MSTKHTSPMVIRSGGRLACASGVTKNEAGQPVQRFRKDILRVGKFVKDSTGQEFEITRESLDEFAATFSAMKAAGVKVPVPVGHTTDPASNRGYADDIYVNGDSLEATIDLIGDDAIALAGRTEVSVCITPELVDGKGVKHTNAIEHIAIVTDPVIPDQKGWVKIAASRGEPRMATHVSLSTGVQTMKLTDIAALLGITATGDDAVIGAEIKTKIEAMQAGAKTASAEMTTLKASLSRASGVPEVDEDSLDMAARAIAGQIDSLERDARVSAKVATDLKSILCGDTATRQNRRVLLSRKAAKACGLDTCVAEQIVETLKQNSPKELGEKAMGQGVTLSRPKPNSDGSMSEEEREKYIKETGEKINASRGFKS